MQAGSKQFLRKEVKRRYGELSSADMAQKEDELSQHLNSLLQRSFLWSVLENDKCFGVFAPLSFEPNWAARTVVPEAWLAFPVVDSSSCSMAFYRSSWKDLKEVDLFNVNLRTPSGESEPCVPSILLVPGMAFTKEGERLGRGKGCYDSFLHEYQGTRIGICFEFQLFPELPLEEHDQEVDYIVTEKRIIDCQKIKTQTRVS